MASLLLKAKHWIVHGGSFKLRPYEMAALEAWRKTLTHEARSLLDEQLKRLNVYQRYGAGRLLCFYDIEDKLCTRWPRDILFTLQTDEASVARLTLKTVGSSPETLKADVMLYRGRFFGFEFSISPKPLRSGFQIIEVKTLLDPMWKCETSAAVSLKEIPGEIQELLRRLKATDLRKPMAAAQREELMQTIDSKLPEDYVRLMAVTEGMTIINWRIYGLWEIRRIVQPEGNFYLLAEATDGRALGVVREAYDAQLYIIDPEGGKAKPAGQSLLAFIERDTIEN